MVNKQRREELNETIKEKEKQQGDMGHDADVANFTHQENIARTTNAL